MSSVQTGLSFAPHSTHLALRISSASTPWNWPKKRKVSWTDFVTTFCWFSSGPWSVSLVQSHEPARGHRLHKEHSESHPVGPVRNPNHILNTELCPICRCKTSPCWPEFPTSKSPQRHAPVSRNPWQTYIIDIWPQVHMMGLLEEGTRSGISLRWMGHTRWDGLSSRHLCCLLPCSTHFLWIYYLDFSLESPSPFSVPAVGMGLTPLPSSDGHVTQDGPIRASVFCSSHHRS